MKQPRQSRDPDQLRYVGHAPPSHPYHTPPPPPFPQGGRKLSKDQILNPGDSIRPLLHSQPPHSLYGLFISSFRQFYIAV